MAAVVPPKPVTNTAIASTWGIDVHNRTYAPLSCMASGLLMVGVTGTQRLSLDTVNQGMASMLDAANNQIVIPVGGSGLYWIGATVQVANIAASTSFARATLMINGGTQLETILLFGAGASNIRNTLSAMSFLADGAAVAMDIIGLAGDAGDYQLRRLTVVRLGDGWGLSPVMADRETDMAPPPQL